MSDRITTRTICGALLLLCMVPASAGSFARVDPRVIEEAITDGEAEFLLILRDRADLAELPVRATKSERGRAVHQRLTAVAARSQPPLLEWLAAREIPHRSFWVVNMIWARADLAAIETLAARDELLRIDANPAIGHAVPPAPAGAPTPTGTIEWGILKTGADQLWAMGYDGSGVVVGGQDTGYEWDHPALIDHYRGFDGVAADHDYNWHDSIHSGGGSCGPDSPFPCDDHSHGTHTMGTIVGDDGGSNRIGMAPGASWIACRNMDEGDGTPASYSECFEWFIAPTDVAGAAPDPSKAPHVINNSWHCPSSEGCAAETLLEVVENTRAAGIVVVVSAGNSGSSCESISTPPAIYDAALTIGATSSSDGIASFSSRGPVTVDGSNRLKPDLSAPGVGVRSSVPGGGYSSSSGTSMAGPHVAGAVALLLDARPDLIGRVEEVEQLLRSSALPLTSNQDCAGFLGSDVPNPTFGHGRLDAVEMLTGDADEDGTDNLTDCAPIDAAVWGAPGTATGLLLSGGSNTALNWNAAIGGGTGTEYDLLRSDSPQDFTSPTCLIEGSTATTASDNAEAARSLFYLVRSVNSCGSDAGQGTGLFARPTGACAESP